MSSIPSERPILEGRGLTRNYRRSIDLWGPGEDRLALTDVDLQLPPGQTVGVVGRSGAGKSALGRCLSLLERPDGGSVLYRGVGHRRLDRTAMLRFRGDVQLVFQDPARALNPRWQARRALEEPIRLLGACPLGELTDRVDELARLVGLDPATLNRGTREFSGGQLTRLNLARSLGVQPEVLILDEPFAGLDVSLQAQIANLLMDIQERQRFACLFISHDLAMVSRLADEVAVLSAGRLVERGSVERVLREPQSAAARTLIDAAQRFTLTGPAAQ